jgi:hypothetical protein
MFIILGTVLALVFSVVIISHNADEMKNNKKKVFKEIAIAIAIGFGFSGLITLVSIRDTKVWNNGYCEKCHGEWELVDVTKSRNNGGTQYYWECENCHHTIRTSSNYK